SNAKTSIIGPRTTTGHRRRRAQLTKKHNGWILRPAVVEREGAKPLYTGGFVEPASGGGNRTTRYNEGGGRLHVFRPETHGRHFTRCIRRAVRSKSRNVLSTNA